MDRMVLERVEVSFLGAKHPQKPLTKNWRRRRTKSRKDETAAETADSHRSVAGRRVDFGQKRPSEHYPKLGERKEKSSLSGMKSIEGRYGWSRGTTTPREGSKGAFSGKKERVKKQFVATTRRDLGR